MNRAKKRGRPPNRRPAIQLFARIDLDIGTAFRSYVESQRPQAKVSSHLELAIEEYLKKNGAWPDDKGRVSGGGGV